MTRCLPTSRKPRSKGFILQFMLWTWQPEVTLVTDDVRHIQEKDSRPTFLLIASRVIYSWTCVQDLWSLWLLPRNSFTSSVSLTVLSLSISWFFIQLVDLLPLPITNLSTNPWFPGLLKLSFEDNKGSFSVYLFIIYLISRIRKFK